MCIYIYIYIYIYTYTYIYIYIYISPSVRGVSEPPSEMNVQRREAAPAQSNRSNRHASKSSRDL